MKRLLLRDIGFVLLLTVVGDDNNDAVVDDDDDVVELFIVVEFVADDMRETLFAKKNK